MLLLFFFFNTVEHQLDNAIWSHNHMKRQHQSVSQMSYFKFLLAVVTLFLWRVLSHKFLSHSSPFVLSTAQKSQRSSLAAMPPPAQRRWSLPSSAASNSPTDAWWRRTASPSATSKSSSAKKATTGTLLFLLFGLQESSIWMVVSRQASGVRSLSSSVFPLYECNWK